MARRMLIDATHPEETRVVVLNGTKLEEFDFETSTKKQIKGNIYLAKVTRVEPSLQAAFVEYGGNRHGFLAFSEIHPDYYRIPVADRDAMIAAANEEEEAGGMPASFSEPAHGSSEGLDHAETYAPRDETGDSEGSPADEASEEPPAAAEPPGHADSAEPGEAAESHAAIEGEAGEAVEPPVPLETVGGDDIEESEGRPRIRHYRHYKIQEVIKRRQILLVQVTKEERGTKGAAITTYLSLAGRYCVLMPNAGRGGGVSRKITSAADRRRLKELMDELEVPDGMGVIVRTAGSERSKTEIKRDFDYLLRLWDDIRDLTLKSSAPALIYEEGNLIKRAIRDLYTRDIDEIQVEGETGYRTAKDFMRMLMPSHAARVKPYRDPAIPLFHRFQIDSQIDQIHNPVVQLKSGGYIVINPTEALVSIDVNSGRATRERNIEETATKTNLEASDEIARQLRLRDLAGLVVIDYIDMEETRNQRAVENRLKEAMKTDRARIQLGRISPFGLLELSRQRLRSSLIEASTQTCPHCNGTGTIRSTESTALVVLRAIEEEGIRRRTAEMSVFVPTHVALYLLNQKRDTLTAIEGRYGFRVTVGQDDTLIPPAYRLERMRALTPEELAALPAPTAPPVEPEPEDEIEEAVVTAPAAEPDEAAQAQGEDRPHRKRRRRKRRRPGDPAPGADGATDIADDEDEPAEGDDAVAELEPATDAAPAEPAADGSDSGEPRRRRRGRRGGRRRRHDGDHPPGAAAETTEPVAAESAYAGTPSPFDFARDGRPELFGDEPDDAAPSEPVPSAPSEPVPVDPVAVEAAPAPETDTPAEAPKKRRTATRKKPAAAPAEAAADEPAPRPKRTRARKPVAETVEPVAPEPPPATESAEEAPLEVLVEDNQPIAEVPVAEAPPADDQPRRTGWWRRLIPTD